MRKPKPKPKLTPEMIRDQFALQAPIGTPCVYYPVKPFREDEAVKTKIRSAPWILGHGAVVVAVEGKAGGVLIEHIVFPAIGGDMPLIGLSTRGA